WFPSKPRFERIARSVGQQRTHPGSGQPTSWLRFVEAVVISRVTVNALSLGFSPRDAPGRMTSRGSNRNNMPHIILRSAKRPFEDRHSTHGSSNDDSHRCDTQVI